MRFNSGQKFVKSKKEREEEERLDAKQIPLRGGGGDGGGGEE